MQRILIGSIVLAMAACGGKPAPAPAPPSNRAVPDIDPNLQIVEAPELSIALGVPKVGKPLACDGAEPTAIHGLVSYAGTAESAPGATVVVSSPAIQGSITAITDERGCFFIALDTPAEYLLTI